MRNPVSRHFVALSCLVFLFSSCKKDTSLSSKSEIDLVIETAPPVHMPVTARVNAVCAGYYAALPARYDSSLKKYPLILFLHGIGEIGNGSPEHLARMVRAGLPRLINRKKFPPSFEVDGQHYSFIVVSPQFKERPSNDEVNEVLNYMVKKYRVDTSRIYVTCLSLGGGVTWDYTAQYGNRVAAAAPICGGSWPDPKRASRIASFGTPVWAFHNGDDKVVPVSYTKDYVNIINSHKPAVAARYTVWPTGGHDSWTKAYDPATKEKGQNMYEWMLSFKR